MRLLRFASAFPALCLGLCLLPLNPIAAQTWTPRHIRFEGGGDPGELLRLSGLEAGKPLTKEQIEAALGKLGETGAFTDLSYTVNGDALVIKLTDAAGSNGQALPVRYMNLVWWQPEELTKLLEEHIPLFHGQLPFTGSLTDHVCAELAKMVAAKGFPNARVEAMQTTMRGGVGHGDAIGLRLVKPEITLGKLELIGAEPSTQRQLDVVTEKLRTQEFDSEVTAVEIRDNAADTEKNAGFLDATVDTPAFSLPREDMTGYVIDAAATVRPGQLYRLAALDLGTKPPLTDADAFKTFGMKTGEPAGAMDVKIAEGKLQRAYSDKGYLDTKLKVQSTLDHAAHTESLRLTFDPGELYRFSGFGASSVPADTVEAFQREFHPKPGAVFDLDFRQEVLRALEVIDVTHRLGVSVHSDSAAHTVQLTLEPHMARTPAPAPAK